MKNMSGRIQSKSPISGSTDTSILLAVNIIQDSITGQTETFPDNQEQYVFLALSEAEVKANPGLNLDATCVFSVSNRQYNSHRDPIDLAPIIDEKTKKVIRQARCVIPFRHLGMSEQYPEGSFKVLIGRAGGLTSETSKEGDSTRFVNKKVLAAFQGMAQVDPTQPVPNHPTGMQASVESFASKLMRGLFGGKK